MNLDVEGRHALLFDDDANAAFVNSRQALVRWSNDESLLIDRYDVRHLLDRIPPRPSKSRIVDDTGGGGVSRSQLDAERFLDLPPPSDDDDGSGAADDKGELASDTTQRSDATGSGAYQAVPFSYGNSDISVGSNGSEFGLKYSSFNPSFAVPESLQSNLPPTEKLHRIIARTAIFVSEHGGQSEIVLRVKQGDNPTFGFLMPDNQLHAYFRFLVEHPQLLKADTVQEEKKSDNRENEALVATGGALSLLGSVYGFGEEDDTAPQEDSKETEPSNPKVADISVVPQSDMGESNLKVVLEEKETIKQRVAAAIKEKTLLVKRNHSVNAPSMSKRGDNIISLQGTVDKPQSSQADKTNEKPLLLEPPSFLKRTMDKIVEFILRNGKEFEAVLIEQDKTAGRFPFLSPSNQYHSYYIKVLQDALESKLLSKNSSDVSKKRRQEASTSDYSVNEQSECWSMDPHRKEKFKMVIGGGPKKDSNEPPPKPARQVGMSADQAAAIVLAATRGRSPANFHSTSVTESEAGRTSSIGGLSSHQHRLPILGPSASNGEAADVSVATAIAKTVALAAASEADSSDASLTKEQKLKAERLKRAKMFAAMIKSGCKQTTELVQASGTPTGHLESSAAGSAHEEREGSSVPFDAGPSHRERKYRKKHRSRSKDHEEEEEESEEDNKHSRKKHRSDDYIHHEEGSRHHRRHRHKHHSDSEDEHGHKKSSRHRHRHKKHDSSEDDWKRSDKKRSKHRSHSERNREREDEDIGKGIDRSETRSEGASDRVEDVGTAEGLDARPSDATTEIPSDLRAKVRAMLLETL